MSRELVVICDVCPPSKRPSRITVPAHAYQSEHGVDQYLVLHDWDCRSDAWGDVCPLHDSSGSASGRTT